jgi:hypothetical protein
MIKPHELVECIIDAYQRGLIQPNANASPDCKTHDAVSGQRDGQSPRETHGNIPANGKAGVREFLSRSVDPHPLG